MRPVASVFLRDRRARLLITILSLKKAGITPPNLESCKVSFGLEMPVSMIRLIVTQSGIWKPSYSVPIAGF